MSDSNGHAENDAARMADLNLDGAYARAFGMGSDARIKGQPRASCPYTQTHALCQIARYWRMGWDHADSQWGKETTRPVPPLPPGDPTHRPLGRKPGPK